MNCPQTKRHFDEASPAYQRALEKSGYNYQLKYETANSQTRSKRPRRRNITWYNPPFSKNVATNVGRKFRNIVNKCFQSGRAPTEKNLQQEHSKISYSCMPNLESRIDAHNKSILRERPQHRKRCAIADRNLIAR